MNGRDMCVGRMRFTLKSGRLSLLTYVEALDLFLQLERALASEPPPLAWTPGLCPTSAELKGTGAPRAFTELRLYQIAVIAKHRAALAAGRWRILTMEPTGSGKTVVAAEIVRDATVKGQHVMFLAHRRELIQQADTKLSERSLDSAIIQAGSDAARRASAGR